MAAAVFISSRRLNLDLVKHWTKIVSTVFVKSLLFMPELVMKLLILYVGTASKVYKILVLLLHKKLIVVNYNA